MAAMNEKDYGVKNDAGPMDATVSPAAVPPKYSPPASLKGKAAGNADTESLNSDITLAAQEEGIDPAFYAKVQVLNRALSEIGMGRYQWELFFSGGFGWFADNICELFWMLGLAARRAGRLRSTASGVCYVVCAICRLPLATRTLASQARVWGMWGIAINGSSRRQVAAVIGSPAPARAAAGPGGSNGLVPLGSAFRSTASIPLGS